LRGAQEEEERRIERFKMKELERRERIEVRRRIQVKNCLVNSLK